MSRTLPEERKSSVRLFLNRLEERDCPTTFTLLQLLFGGLHLEVNDETGAANKIHVSYEPEMDRLRVSELPGLPIIFAGIGANDWILTPEQLQIGNQVTFMLHLEEQLLLSTVFLHSGNDAFGTETWNVPSAIDCGAGDDSLNVRGTSGSVIYGQSGADTIEGGWATTLFGGTGNDTLSAEGGICYIYGDEDNDTISGSDDSDLLFGGDGNDEVYGQAGRDTISGGGGDDRIFGNQHDDTIYGDAGTDFIHGGTGDDTIYGYTNSFFVDENLEGDYLFGEIGNDTLRGAGGQDLLDGGAGEDVLESYSGADLLIGGSGADIIDGGDGADEIWNAGNGQQDFWENDNLENPVRDSCCDVIDGGDGWDTVYIEVVAGEYFDVFDFWDLDYTLIPV